MRIVIDLQGAQSESRFRGIGRYSLALALGVARNAGPHEVWLLLNGALGAAIPELRRAFDGLVPAERICVFEVPAGLAELHPGHSPRTRAAELLREYAISQLQADVVLVTSLFEGFVDDSVVTVGSFAGAERTAVVLYDLIPFLSPQAYLSTPAQRQYYDRKIASLRQAGLLLAISDYAREEAIDALQLDPHRVVAISTAVDDTFCRAAPDPLRWDALRARFGLSRAMLMYAPGGFDARKNIDGLISAYALLSPQLRASHQLLIASKIGADDRSRLLAHATRSGLAADELILTGYVDDHDLIELYRNAALFVFPSRHEGFGLPALEAMACGAPVIGADNTSIPEVVGLPEALFDAASPAAIAAKISEVLSDPALQQRLREHGREQSARFSWDVSAQRAVRALEAWRGTAAASASTAAAAVSTTRPRPRLAFVSPLPPERTGIADYAAQLLPALSAHFEIELVLQQPQLELPPSLDALPRRDVAWFDAHAGEFDQILYQFGNSPFHSHMFALLRRHPGVVVLHDFYLSSVLSHEQMTGALPGAWSQALFESHGYPALLAGQQADQVQANRDLYPSNLAVLQDATRVIVHSEHARTLARHWYGAQAAHNWNVVPLPRALPAQQDRAGARRALGIAAEAFLVCSFGFIAPTKLTLELLQAWSASTLQADRDCVLVLVGANHGGDYGAAVSAAIAAAGPRIRIAGWTDEAVYHQYLQAADVGVQLRSVSRGETSAAVLDCMNYGLATIVNANGSMAALPTDAVWQLPDQFDLAALSAALDTLRSDSARRLALGSAAATLLHTEHSPAHAARLYAAALAQARHDANCNRPALLAALAARDDLPRDDGWLQQLSACIARAADPTQPRQLLVDVTAIARHDLKTGIERVVRQQVRALLRAALPGWRVEPVYLSDEGGRWHYRYARRYTAQLLGIQGQFQDPAADTSSGDVFYSADYSPGTVAAAAAAGLYAHWRARGVSVNFLVHDLLPVLRPEFFPAGADRTHAGFLDCIAANSDRLIAISAAVREELHAWLSQRSTLPAMPRLAVLHHGADIDEGAAAPAADDAALLRFAELPSFLMVGTIEPRKGHLQALDAFEQLWAEGVQANLVIVGSEGWKPLAALERRTIPLIVERLRNHPQQGRHLAWLQGLDDHALQQLYRDSACLLVPSEGEGFGLPLIEAARQGLPVMARDLPVFREVAGDHACYFSSTDGAGLAQALRDWLALDAQGTAPASAAMPWQTWADNAAALLEVVQGRRDRAG
jgi:glycosyltransferase involved in cell wall biosynthesis